MEAALLSQFTEWWGIDGAQVCIDTFDWQAARESYYERGEAPAMAASEELYAICNS